MRGAREVPRQIEHWNWSSSRERESTAPSPQTSTDSAGFLSIARAGVVFAQRASVSIRYRMQDRRVQLVEQRHRMGL